MNNKDILNIALRQSATDLSCAPEDLLADKNVIVISRDALSARKYLTLPFDCNFVSYGSNIVASVSEDLADIAKWYISSFPKEHCFETPNMLVLDDAVKKRGYRVCFMAEYFLPDVDKLEELTCEYETQFMQKGTFADLYTSEWSNALCEKRKEFDMLCVGAYDAGKLVGLAGASADCGDMWQIGIDVLPRYRKRGIAASLTSKLAIEVLTRNKVPFYCAAWSNIASVRNAIKCGFRPSWCEMTVKRSDFVNEMNNNIKFWYNVI